MKTLVLDQTGQLGGGELSLLDLLPAWPGAVRVALFADGPFREALQARGIAVEVWPGGALLDVRREQPARAALHALPALAGLLRRIRHAARDDDLIYANSQKAFVAAALGVPARVPLIWHLRDLLTSAHFSRGMRRLAVTLANRRAACVIANSQATADAFVTAGGAARKLRVVHNGIDPAPFDALGGDQVAAARVALGLRADMPVVGLFGRLTPWKGQSVLLEALARLPGVQGLIVGAALFGEDAYAARLRDRAAQPDLAGRVRFLGFRHDIPALMKAVDVVCHAPVDPEPFGRVIVEGMLAGRPLEASAAGGVLELIDDGVTGVLVPPGDVAALAVALRRVLDDAVLAARLASAGGAAARSRFSLAAMRAGVYAVLQEVRMQQNRSMPEGDAL